MQAGEAIEVWLRDGLISPEHAHVLRQSLEEHEAPRRSVGFVQLLAFAGAALVGAGLLAFIGGQWDQQAPARRLLLVLIVYAFIVGAAALAARQQLHVASRALWFLSTISAGVVIFLIGQIYNLPLNWWLGAGLWAAIAVVTGWASPSFGQGLVAVVLGVLTLGWISTPSAEFFDQAAFLVDPRGLRPLIALVGVALIALAVLVDGTDFGFLGEPARGIGVTFIAVPLIISTFAPELFALVFEIEFRLFHVLVAIACIALAAAAVRRNPRSPLAIVAAVVTVLWVLLMPRVDATPSTRFFDHMDRVPWLSPLLFDSSIAMWLWGAVVFVLALGATELGRRYEIPALVSVGFASMGILLIATYIGRIAGALPTALALLVGGIFIIAVAIGLERKRRDLIASVQA